MFSDKIHTLNTAVRAEDEKLQSLNDKLEGFKEKLRRVSEAVCMLTSRSQRIEQQKRDHKALTQNILTDTVNAALYDDIKTVKRCLPGWCKVTIDDKRGRLPKHMEKYKNKDAIVIGYAHTKGQPVQIMLGMKTDDGILTNEDGSIHVLTMDHTCVRCKTEATRRNIRKRKLQFGKFRDETK